MAEPSPDSGILKTIGPWLYAAVCAIIGWLLPGGLSGAMGSALMSLLAFVGAVSGFIFPLVYNRYLGILGAGSKRKGTSDREGYDRLRASLVGGNLASRLYSNWLTKSLDAVDRFFGDAGMSDRTLFPRAFGLKTPAPLWTAPAFDRCLLLALIYPIGAVLIMWAVSGHVGPAEKTLGLQAPLPGWARGTAIVIIGLTAFGYWRSRNPSIWTELFVFFFPLPVVFSVAGAVAGAVGGAVTGAVAGASASATAFAGAVVVAGAVAGAFALAVAGNGASADAFTSASAWARAVGSWAFVFAGAGAFTSTFAVDWLYDVAIRMRRQGLFLVLLFVAMTLGCLLAGYWLSSSRTWPLYGPLLLFLGLFTLLNAPFDWASLGLTRALLRRGLELGGWWPYSLAIVDALFAVVIIILLALTMVIGVQTFDHLAEHSGGVDARLLPLDELFRGITTQPSAPEYWWVYALLLSTMIPSLINLMIGGTSLLRGVPGLPTLLLRFMPASKAVATYDRTWLALVLTCQVFAGAFLGIAAQAFLAIGVLFYILPWMGFELLDVAQAVAHFDLPMRVLRLWWGD